MTSTPKNYESELKEAFKDAEIKKTRPHRYWITVKKEELVDSVKTLMGRFGFTHLTTIAGEDMKDSFLLNYIFSKDVVLTLRTKIDREKPEIPSLAAIIDGAIVYERELHDLFGIVPLGHPDLRRQALPEDWPEGVYPLRKDVKIPRPTLEEAKDSNETKETKEAT
jgi:Ni,Fe-hydrogenase III component G